MLRVSIAEMNVWSCRAINVCLVVVVVGDRLFGLHHLTDIDGGCFGADFQMIV